MACNEWLRMGPSRTFHGLIKTGKKHKNHLTTGSVYTLRGWAKKYQWQSRAAAYDNEHEAQKNDRRDAVMAAGLALDYERVEKLKRLALFLETQIYEQGKEGVYHNVWLPDVKQIGNGESAERVNLERFNGPLLSEFRAALDDIAKEVGGRRKVADITANINVTRKVEELTDDELGIIALSGSS